jgi:predicted small lipoprotein YifL
MNRSLALFPTLLVLLVLALSGCGNKGPLVLPSEAESDAAVAASDAATDLPPAADESAPTATEAPPLPPPPPSAGRHR